MADQVGRVYLVGAGPGDPGLLTLRGQHCLLQADVVLYDYLANPDTLSHAQHAEKICLGQHGRSPIWSQDEINHRLIQLAREGKTVVRLKGGDPAIFARGAEEVEALAREGIPCELVPGITAALAAGSYAGIPVTHREHASAVALITGQERNGEDATLDYAALAIFPGTLVFYMGVTTAPRWVPALIAAGKPASTPTALIRRCSHADQTTHFCQLEQVPELIREQQIRPPVVMIVGDVVRWGQAWGGAVQPPLFGQSVLITRPRDQAESLAIPLRALGAAVWTQPAIEIGPPTDWERVDEVLGKLSDYDWLVFTSANGVRYFLDRLLARGLDLRALGSCQLAAVGPGTAAALGQYHLQADVIASNHAAEGLSDALRSEVEGKRLLWARASRGREVLGELLRPIVERMDEIVVYEHRDVEAVDPEILRKMEAGEFQWVTVSSSAIARSLVQLFGDSLRKCRLVSISPLTTQELQTQGFPATAEARQPTMEAMIDALLQGHSPAD